MRRLVMTAVIVATMIFGACASMNYFAARGLTTLQAACREVGGNSYWSLSADNERVQGFYCAQFNFPKTWLPSNAKTEMPQFPSTPVVK